MDNVETTGGKSTSRGTEWVTEGGEEAGEVNVGSMSTSHLNRASQTRVCPSQIPTLKIAFREAGGSIFIRCGKNREAHSRFYP